MTENSVTLKINGQDIAMNPFVQNILKNAVEAIAKELDGYRESGDRINTCISFVRGSMLIIISPLKINDSVLVPFDKILVMAYYKHSDILFFEFFQDL